MNGGSFGSAFERIFVGVVAVVAGAVLIYLAVQGPLVRGVMTFKTAPVVVNQLVGQDLVNLVLLSPLLILGGIGLFLKKAWAKDLLIATPLFLIYYVMSYTIGWEWGSPSYSGNSEHYTFFFLFELITALIVLLYTLAVFPKNVVSRFKKGGLAAYAVVCLFYGFFFTQILAVNAMGWMMFLKKDPTFLMRDMVVFTALALIILFGFFYIRRNYRVDQAAASEAN